MQEAKRPVPALDDRPGEVQGIHVEEQVQQRGGEEPWVRAAVQQRHREQPPVLAGRDRLLVELEGFVQDLTLGRQDRRQRDDDGRRDQDGRDGQDLRIATTAGEVSPRPVDVAGLLGQPAESVRDLGTVGGGRPPFGLTVGADRGLEIPFADVGGRDVAPGRVRRRRLPDLQDGLPGRQGGAVLAHPEPGLAEPEQCGGRDRRVVETDDAPISDRGLRVVARSEESVALRQQRGGVRGGQAALP